MAAEKIVLFESHSIHRNVIHIGLISQGYKIVSYPHIANIDDAIQREDPCLILIAVPLEGTDPYLPTRFCQACYPWLPIVQLVGDSTEIDPQSYLAALRQGCTDMLVGTGERVEILLQRIHDLIRPGTHVDQRALLRAYAGEWEVSAVSY